MLTAVPPERLNHIARTKLEALSISVRLSPDGRTLEGVLPFPGGEVRHPVTGVELEEAPFVVVGHDSLRFTEPPLSGLPPVQFYNADRLALIEERVAQALNHRFLALETINQRLRALGLEPTIDEANLTTRAVLKSKDYAFELLGVPNALRVSRVMPLGGAPMVVGDSVAPLELGRLSSRAGLEKLLLETIAKLPEASKAAPQTPASPPVAARGIEVVKPAPEALSLSALVQKFGDAALSPASEVEIIQEYKVGEDTYQFFALREVGTVFAGRLVGPSGDEWEESFDLQVFPGTRQLVLAVLGKKAAAAGKPVPAVVPSRPAPVSRPTPGPVPATPAAGQYWMMTVLVEQQSSTEVRYACTNAEGAPYGAARVLPRAAFESTFFRAQTGWRLLIRIEQVKGGLVRYRQVDSRREPRGELRQMDVSALVANFAPEPEA